MPVLSCNVCTCVSVSVVCVIAGSVLLSNGVACGSCLVSVSSWCTVHGGVGISVVCVHVLIVISVGCLTVSAVGAVGCVSVSSSYRLHGCVCVAVGIVCVCMCVDSWYSVLCLRVSAVGAVGCLRYSAVYATVCFHVSVPKV